MTSISLSEQMGAMGVVDDLRHKQLLAKELLNLPERRAEVVRRLSDYYRSKNIEVTNEVLEKGVRVYFSKRLVFESPSLGVVTRILSTVAITRATWVPRTLLLALLCAVLFAGTLYATSIYKDSVVAGLKESIRDAGIDAEQLRSNIGGLQGTVAHLQAAGSSNDLPSDERMLHRAAASLTEADRLLSAKPNYVLSYESHADVERAIEQDSSNLSAAKELLTSAMSDITGARLLIEGSSELDQTTTDKLFAPMAEKYKALQKAAVDARQVLTLAGSVTDAQQAKLSVAKVAYLLSVSARVHALQYHLDDIKAELVALKLLDSGDYLKVDAVAAKATAALQSLDAQATEKHINELIALKTLAQTTYTLQIVDRVGIKTGIERRLDGSAGDGGKSWYVVVEAIDPAGNIIQQQVTSSETGSTRLAKYFGLRVTHDQYMRVREDKKADGKVDNKVMGEKPLRTLKTAFNERVHPSTDMILEW